MKNLKMLGLSLIILSGMATQPVKAETFVKEQKEEIEKVIEDFLLRNPEILEKVSQKLQEKHQEKKASQNKNIISTNAVGIFHNNNDPFIGNPQGHKKLVVFMDPFCGHCRKLHKTLNMVAQDSELKDVKIIFKDLPIFGEISNLAVRSTFAAKNQGKYLEFQNAVFELNSDVTEQDIYNIAEKLTLDIEKFKADLSSETIEKKISENEALASTLGIDATPTLIYGDAIIPGALNLSDLKELFSSTSKNKN